jgi:hypothetical protein
VAENSPRDRYLKALMSHVAGDNYPSVTQMNHLEQLLDREQLETYLNVLIEKVENDNYPSTPMMTRIENLLERLR